ncbi:MAG: PKD domain-containing protein [Bacteroidota bacterium]
MIKRLLRFIPLLLFFISSQVFSQQITINTVDPGPYTVGSTITALFTTGNTTCIRPGNVFGLWLSDANGSFADEQLIGTYSGFYGTFVNGVLTTSTPIVPGTGYQVRIKSTSPANIISNASAPFEIKAGAAAEAKLSSTLLDSSNPEVFGFCSGRANQSFNLTNASTSSSSTTARIINELTPGPATDLLFNTQTKQFTADLAHYTIFVKALAADGTVATTSYQLVNNQTLTTFSTQGSNRVCLPGGALELPVTVDGSNGIANNYPGSTYRVSWGDNTEDIYTLCDIRSNGNKVTHNYSTSSCGKVSISGPNIDYNVFGINISTENAYCGRVGAALSTTARVVNKPTNNFDFDTSSCLNSDITFTNTSDPGSNPNTNSPGCIENTVVYTWFVDGVIVAVDKPKSYALHHIFTTPGTHLIRLESTSTTATCPADPIEKAICVQAKPVPSFTLNGTNGTTICGPVVLKPHNTSIVDNNCSSNSYLWIITGGVVNPVNSTSLSSFEPELNFLTNGTYKIKLRITTPSCGSYDTDEQTIIVNTQPKAELSPNITLCNLDAYIFNETSGPAQTLLSGTELELASTYSWTVSGGNFDYAPGSGPNSKYPIILFKEYKTYTITVTHTNNCSTVSDTQVITFKESPKVQPGTYAAICYNDVINLQGTISEAVVSFEWTGGGGTFSNKNSLNTTYTPSAAERTAGHADLTLTAITALDPPCNSIPGYTSVLIKPLNTLTSNAEKRICTGTRLGYNPLSTIPGSTFTWTVVNSTPNVSGFNASGSGNVINDLLSNSSATANASVTYRITPSAEGCIGEPFDFTATVTPIPIAAPTPANTIICSGQSAAIALNANIPSRFLWSTTASGNISGNIDNVIVPATSPEIDDMLINTGMLPETVTYEITPVSEDGCYGTPVSLVITVNPPATVANAGADEIICSQPSYTFSANPPSVGAGKWTLVSGPAAGISFADDTKNNTIVSGLQDGVSYVFRWTITTVNNCSTSQDEVTITVNKPTNGGTTSGAVLACSGDNGGQISLTGNEGNVIRWESSVNGLNWLPLAETGTSYAYTNLTATTQFRAVVKSGICPEATSTITTITVTPPTVPANAGPGQTLCNASSFTLTGNNPAPNTGMWTQLSGPAGATITTPNSNVTTVTGVVSGETYQFQWTITGDAPCQPSTGILTIVNLAPLENTISSNNSTVCSEQTIVVSGSDPTGGNNSYSYIWQSSPNGNTWTTINGQNNRDLNVILTTTLFFRRTVISNACSLTSAAVQVNAFPPLSGNTIAAAQTICEGSTPVALTGTTPTGGDGVYSYRWQMSTDGTTWNEIAGSGSINFSPPALAVTTRYRRLVGTQACTGPLESISNVITIKVNPNAKAEFSFLSDVGCVPFVINNLNVKAVPYPDRNLLYTWYANGTSIGTGISFPGYTILTTNQQVTIKLVVTSSVGCSQAETSHVFATPKSSQALFTMDKTEGCGPLTIAFTNRSIVTGGTTYRWNFGNGQTSTNESPGQITFLPDPTGNDKIYHVTLIATTPCGPSQPYEAEVLVRGKVASIFSPDRTVGCSPMNVTFTNNSPDASKMKYIFDFGDGSPKEEKQDRKNVFHRYTTVDSIRKYTVKMIAIGECGIDSSKYTIEVSPNTVRPELVVNSTDKRGCAPFTVRFHNNSKGADHFEYDFKDGGNTRVTLSAPEVVSYTFSRPGKYKVLLTASNGCASDTTTETIEVLAQPQVAFTADKTSGCPDLEVKFTSTSTDGATYLWDFGDGSSSAEKNPVHLFNGLRPLYTIKLTVTNSLGCPATLTMPNYIRVLQPPIAAFNVEPGLETEIPNYTFRFSDASNRSPDGWLWDFGDNTTSTEKNPNHTYADVGAYTVTLTVKNQTGCASVIVKTVKITGVPGYLQLPNSFIPGNELTEFRLFKAKGTGLKSWKFSVFDKWGELIWETTKLDEDGKPTEGWDGTFKGSAMPQGVYFWKADVQFINGSEWKGMSYGNSAPKRTGIIHLIR